MIYFARLPNLNDLNVSFSFDNEGQILITSFVIELPPRLS